MMSTSSLPRFGAEVVDSLSFGGERDLGSKLSHNEGVDGASSQVAVSHDGGDSRVEGSSHERTVDDVAFCRFGESVESVVSPGWYRFGDKEPGQQFVVDVGRDAAYPGSIVERLVLGDAGGAGGDGFEVAGELVLIAGGDKGVSIAGQQLLVKLSNLMW